jgi:hypothetical protein
MPDFGVTPASSLAELAEMEQAARDRFEMFSKSEYFPEDFDILTEQGNLESLFDAERARLQGTYTLPEFKVEDTKGLLTQNRKFIWQIRNRITRRCSIWNAWSN